jgi:hypothetical protein
MKVASERLVSAPVLDKRVINDARESLKRLATLCYDDLPKKILTSLVELVDECERSPRAG